MLAESITGCPIFAPVHSWLSSSSPCLFSPLHKDPVMVKVPVENSSPKFFSEDLRSAAGGYTSASFEALWGGGIHQPMTGVSWALVSLILIFHYSLDYSWFQEALRQGSAVENSFGVQYVAEPLGSQCLDVYEPLCCLQDILSIWYCGSIGCTIPQSQDSGR